MLTLIYVDILPIILVNICGCNQICITYFPRNKKRPFARSWFTNEAVNAYERRWSDDPFLEPGNKLGSINFKHQKLENQKCKFYQPAYHSKTYQILFKKRLGEGDDYSNLFWDIAVQR